MASEPDDWRREVETTRLEIERIGLALEHDRKQLEQVRLFLERWKIDVAPVQERKERSREFTNQFAQLALKAPFLLNGGAVIAFPAFAKIANVPMAESPWVFIASIAAFIFGLIVISVTNLLAYLAMDVDTWAIRSSEEIVKTKLNATQNANGELTDEQQEHIEHNQVLMLELAAKTNSLKKWAISLGISSIVLFLIGAGLAAFVMAPTSN